ncbi:BlaI/MecI/CopY family transcriptional regulator [Halosquirtibacter laminarini]|uniref:BlaI/MecI/CopY family transcriptional regulator n=1 Tax=Halosquirtibacter laminarini TaxID=3374600 RepID=A0AC61NC29_9BACT|nr:BlaI/MecI/CopY family transcriptional regulator [Prolixibacteraceae bacterium]
MKELTRAEEQVMLFLWDMDKAFVKQLVEMYEMPQPAYNTVSTIVRILERKGFVSYKAFGRSHQYFPIISKEEYKHSLGMRILRDYFNNSFIELNQFFMEKGEIKPDEFDKITNIR